MSWKYTRAGQRLISLIGDNPENKQAAAHHFMYKAFRSGPAPSARVTAWNTLKKLLKGDRL